MMILNIASTIIFFVCALYSGAILYRSYREDKKMRLRMEAHIFELERMRAEYLARQRGEKIPEAPKPS